MKGFRTILFNLVAVMPLAFDFIAQQVQAIESSQDIRGLIPDEWLPVYGLVLALVNIWLRTKTDTPVGKPTPNPAALVVVKSGETAEVEQVSVAVSKGDTTETAEETAAKAAIATVDETRQAK
ncbi:hypothetical protein [Paenirhodobacter populi]|uniref:Uncharacterized protein n=1 Tax=Paenirhodobacter populi TaxID=2306993 RepID=A0A443IZT1_9RHOB|nr:hypothetical protein [Sinirhodobacter populi]RWR13815.1 hypothetical protein D2T33_05300 [Sinirhodobacter populi]